ncbi:MAG TPA: DUF4157 domain-containing protein [Steroidobacteraceae bacterium]|nr:DUF4157 domain-containing protein [Steroidobacteraceae bacterium]
MRSTGGAAKKSETSPTLTPKILVGRNDPVEREAERIADNVAQDAPIHRPDSSTVSDSHITRARSQGDFSDLLTARSDATATPATDGVAMKVRAVLRTTGQPLDEVSRANFEPRFGRDFSAVRVHTDTPAAESAKAVSALAYTVGNHVVFAQHQFAPQSNGGRLLAHELTHVAQQGLNPAATMGVLRRTPDEKAPAMSGARSQAQLPARTQTTLHDIQKLKAEHPGLSDPVADYAVVHAPPGARADVRGKGGVPVAGQAPKSADVEFRTQTPEGHVVLRREVKVLEGGQASFNGTVSTAADQLLAEGGGGEILIQVPSGSDARGLIQRFKSAGGLTRDAQALRLGRYRSMRIIVLEPSGSVLVNEPLEFPPLRTFPIRPPGGGGPSGGGGDSSAGAVKTAKASVPAKPGSPAEPLSGVPKTKGPGAAPLEEEPALGRPVAGGGGKAVAKGVGKAAVIAALQMALGYVVKEAQLAELEENIAKAKRFALPVLETMKAENPDNQAYLRITIRSSSFQQYIPLYGWVPAEDRIELYSFHVTTQRVETVETKTEDYSFNVLRPGTITYTTYTEPLDLPASAESLRAHPELRAILGLARADAIRPWIAAHDDAVVMLIATDQKIRLSNLLLDGWVRDSDVDAIEKIVKNATPNELSALKAAIAPRIGSLSSIGQRTRLRLILD